MKAYVPILCVVGALALSACGSGDGFFLNSSGGSGNVAGDVDGDGNVDNLKTFVLANCNKATSGDAASINGASFPANLVTDPANSVYTSNCLP